MKAIVWTKYGSPDGLQLKEVEKPIPGDNEVLIKIYATTVTAGDSEVRSLNVPLWLLLPIRLYLGLLRPRNRILGQELAGEIEAVGKDVQQFRKGDLVFGTTGLGFGAYADYIRLPETSGTGVLAAKPANMSFEEAAAVPTAALEALHFLRQGNIRSGQKVLINGAGGSIGTFAVQLAKYYGAEVSAVDSTGKLDMLRSLGADHVIDYTQEDFSDNGQTYDVIFDVVGKTSFSRSIRSLSTTGVYMLGNSGLSQKVRALWISMSSRKKVVTGTANHDTDALIFLKQLIEAGKLKSVIDRSYPLEQIADAHRYVDTGHKKGNVVITVADHNKS
jgi:NADPH:quinone reductase-like Zn-dependent oxidoreductase